MKIPVIINNRDLLTWPKAMVERIKKYDNVGDIIIIDNQSTNPELLEWYETAPCIIYKLDQNMGHAAPWDSGIVKLLGAKFYVVSDPDMGLDETPNDTLNHLLEKEKQLNLGKIGLGLKFTGIPITSRYFNHVLNYEEWRWKNSRVQSDIRIDVAIDTTFALYSKDHYFIGGGCASYPYVARHYPWEFTDKEREENTEFMYYLKNATYSSSYKKFIGM